MSKSQARKYIKTKFEGVFYRVSKKRDPHTGEQDKIYCFWYSDAEGKGHWKKVGRHSAGVRPQTARLARANLLAELSQGVDPVTRDKLTVGEAVEAYVIWATNEKKHVKIPHRHYCRHLQNKVHALPIISLTPGMLTTLKAQLRATPKIIPQPKNPPPGYIPPPPQTLSDQTVHHLFSFLRRAINRAISTGLWNGANPLTSSRGGAWQMPRVDNCCLRFLTPSEATLLLQELANHSIQLHDMALLSLKTGLRATEIFKLRGQDLDAHSGIIHVTSKGGKRDPVHVPTDVMQILQGYVTESGSILFPKRGTVEQMTSTSSTFSRVVQSLGLSPSNGDRRFSVTFHTLRHTFASWLAQSGKVSLLELKLLMRHESLSMTQRYAHLIPGQEREKLSIIGELLTNASPSHNNS